MQLLGLVVGIVAGFILSSLHVFIVSFSLLIVPILIVHIHRDIFSSIIIIIVFVGVLVIARVFWVGVSQVRLHRLVCLRGVVGVFQRFDVIYVFLMRLMAVGGWWVSSVVAADVVGVLVVFVLFVGIAGFWVVW